MTYRDSTRHQPPIIVAAVADDLVAGTHGRLPWHASDDLRHFRRLTFGHPVIMGQRTWDSLARPFDGRINIVLSDDASFHADGAHVAPSLHEALTRAGAGPVFVIGGRRPWNEALPLADTIHLTRIHARFDGDVHFPAIDPASWQEARRDTHTGIVSGSPTRLDFITYTRRDTAGAAMPADRSARPETA
ncbi:dihydrofolate reductase [Actinoplanes sp. CA-054009]